MLKLEELEAKVVDIAKQIEQSAANHNVLIGAKFAYEGLMKELREKLASEKSVDKPIEKQVLKGVKNERN